MYYLTRDTRFPETEKISPPLLQMDEVTFGYTPDKIVLKGVNIDVGLDSRIAMVGANGAGKSTLYASGSPLPFLSEPFFLLQNQNSHWGVESPQWTC
jgi:hypothetical protein